MSIIQANAILDASGGNTTTVNGVTPNSDSVRGRNLIINGAMNVAQRGTQTGHATGYTLDRWNVRTNGSARFTVSKDTDVPSGYGFGSSIKIDVTTDDTVAAGDFGAFRTILEGQDVQSICKGSSNAKQLTLSFWIKSTVTGTYTVELYDNDNARQVSGSYTVNTSNTWENKTITFPADTTGSFDNDNEASLYIQFGLAMGSNFSSGTLSTTWSTVTTADRFAGQVNAFSSTSNNIYFTGVKLEVGSVATEFDHRSFGEELALCQRYFYGGFENDPHPTNASALPMHATSPARLFPFQGADFPVSMRTTPSVSIRSMQSGSQTNNATSGYSDGVNHTVTNINGPHASRVALYLQSSDNITDDEPQMFHFKADAEL